MEPAMSMTENNWLSEHGRSQIEFFLGQSDEFLVERARAIRILCDLFKYHFEGRSGLRLLDVGSGNGIVSRILLDRFPGQSVDLMDGSLVMLDEARKTLAGAACNFIHRTFEDHLNHPPDEQRYDFIYSAMAIHHLTHPDKVRMYSGFFQSLGFGGLFVNYDVVKPPSDRSEAWAFQLWRDWINENLARQGRTAEIGKHDGLPEVYQLKAENKPSGLLEQLAALQAVGFEDVDCYFKYGIFALFGGTKA
jgi:tRNA (cmo5U34)-methyltransferase